MPLINLDAVLNPLPELKDHILDYIPRATTSEFGIVALGSGINVDIFGRIYLDTQEYSDRLTAIETTAASTLETAVNTLEIKADELAASITQKLGTPNGIATLDSAGSIPSSQLPSYVDDVLEYASVATFPTTGETGKIYVETIGNTTYRWSGTTYVKITSGEVSSVAGKKGIVTLTKDDVGLSNVDNTNDLNKPLSTATQTALTALENKGKRGIINLYDTSLIYGLNERVALTNGDIVKSTIDGNSNNPNNDMTGWFNESKSITRILQSLAELSTVAGRTDQQLALVMGLGGGRFYWDAVSTEPDDGGLVISVGVGITGRWKRITQGFIDFEMFGAKGFPNNDHTAIKNALGALAKGYRLEAKAGAKYLLTGSDIFIDLPYKSSAVLNFNNAELVCGCIVQISSLQPDVMLSLTGDVRMGATSIPVVSAAEVSVGDVIVLDSPALRDTIGTTTRQTYRVRDVVDNTIFIFGEVVCDMTAAQIAASGKTGSLTLRLVKALNKVTVNNLQHRHYNYVASPEEVSFRVNKTSVVEIENSTIHGPLRAGIRHADCGEVYHYGTKAENVGYAKGDTTAGDVGNQYGYAVIATNTWKIRYTTCRFAGGWTGLDSAIGVVLTESRDSTFENTFRGLSTHPGSWLLDIQDSSFINASFGASSTSGVIAKNNTFKAKPTISQNIQLPKKPNNGMIIKGNTFIDFAATNGDTFTTAYTGGTGAGSLSENIKIRVDISDNEFIGVHGLLLSELESETLYIQRNKLKTPMTALRTNNYLAVRFPTSLCVIDDNEFWASSISRDIEFSGAVSDGLEIRIENNIKKYSYGNLSFPSLVRLPLRGTAPNCKLIVRGNSGNYTSDLLRYTSITEAWIADLISGNDGFLMPCMREQDWSVKVYANNIMKTLPHAKTVITQNHNNLIIV